MRVETQDLHRADIENLYQSIVSRYDVHEKELMLGEVSLSLLCVRDTNALVDAISPEEFSDDERLPYWSDIWTSSIGLASYVLNHDSENPINMIRGSRVLELGSGLGLVGIAAALAGCEVVITDYDPDAIEFSRYNALRNLPSEYVKSMMRFELKDWREPMKLGTFDLILAADVVYEKRQFHPLISTLRQTLAPHGRAIFAEPNRTIGKDFFSLLAQEGFNYSISSHAMAHEERESMILHCEIVND